MVTGCWLRLGESCSQYLITIFCLKFYICNYRYIPLSSQYFRLKDEKYSNLNIKQSKIILFVKNEMNKKWVHNGR